MELEHTFTVPVPPQQAFAVMQDIERIGPCMPGATVESVDGRSFSGKVKVKIGPIQVTYSGEAEYTELDEEGLRATIVAKGKETRGSGTATATVKADLREVPDGAEVHVVTDLAITGKPAQFGRGVMAEVGQKLIDQFAACLSEKLGEDQAGDAPATAEDPDATPPTGTPAATPQAPQAPRTPAPDNGAIDLLDVAGAPVAKRAAPVGAALLLLILFVVLKRRRRRG